MPRSGRGQGEGQGKEAGSISGRGLVLLLILLLAAIHGALWLLPAGSAMWWDQVLALIPARLIGTRHGFAGGELARWTSVPTHMLVHADLPHLAINAIALALLGPELAARLGPRRFLLLLLASGAGGAALFTVLNAASLAPMIGASGAISGLLAGRLRIPARGEPGTLRACLRRPDVRVALAVFVAVETVVALISGGWSGNSLVAWEAHLGGLVTGLLVFGALDARTRQV